MADSPIRQSNQELRTQDVELYDAWKNKPAVTTLSPLLKNLDPLIQREVNRWQGTLARPYLETQAKKLAVEAIGTFDPNRGVRLSTHVGNRLQKLSRPNYTHQNLARIPEHRMMKFFTFNSVRGRLVEELGREPTTAELAKELTWSLPAVRRFNTEQRRELLTSQEGPEEDRAAADNMVHYVYHDLPPIQQQIFEMKTGYFGNPVVKPSTIRKRLGLTQGQLSYQQTQITKKFKGSMP